MSWDDDESTGEASSGRVSAFEEMRPQLERLAVQTYIDLMTDSTVDPSVRKASADSVMKALGKDAPPKATGNTIVMNFGSGLKTALSGVGQLQALLARPVEPEGVPVEVS